MSLNTAIVFSITILLTMGLLIYRLGKTSRENEILNNNHRIKKNYENNKNHINSGDALSKRLQNGKY